MRSLSYEKKKDFLYNFNTLLINDKILFRKEDLLFYDDILTQGTTKKSFCINILWMYERFLLSSIPDFGSEGYEERLKEVKKDIRIINNNYDNLILGNIAMLRDYRSIKGKIKDDKLIKEIHL